MKPAEWARVATYLAGFAVGVFATVHGMLHGDAANTATGLALMGVSGVAVPNVPGVKGE